MEVPLQNTNNMPGITELQDGRTKLKTQFCPEPALSAKHFPPGHKAGIRPQEKESIYYPLTTALLKPSCLC